ncbi:MAG: glycosyl transferase [Firmicutes bacterium]|nr:glycosyl transferase [Bacillota bacterium]
MSKVVFFGFPGHGHTNPTLGVVKELIRRGEEIIYFSAPEYQPQITRAGAVFRKYQFSLFQKNRLEKKLDPNTLNQVGKEAFYRMKLYFDIIENKRQDLKKLLAKMKPDYIIHDSCANWGKFLAKTLGIPAICSMTTFAYCERVLETHPEFVLRKILRTPDHYLVDPRDSRKVIQRLTQMLGNLFGIAGYDFFDLAYSLEPLNIVYTSKEFQFFNELFDPSFKFVGPSLEFRDDSRGLPRKLSGKRLIYISLGTVDNLNPAYPDFYRKCFAAFGNLSHQVVMAVRNANIRKLGKIPDNFTVCRSVPQLEILKQADLFVTHGGMNSANEALYFNVPMIVVPQRVDQFQVAWRVANLGAGIAMKNMEFTARELQEAATEVLTNKSYREQCKIIGASLKAAGGHTRAADEIFQFKIKQGIQ